MPGASTPLSLLHEDILRWYAAHARPLPWRTAGTSAWGIYLSEIMAQQTPVARVVPVWQAWLDRWPSPAALAADAPGEAVRAWGRLGYPRRALRLHEAATVMVREHGGQVPGDLAALRALPGVGEYTAAAVACFAFRVPVPVIDTNVRRVLVRTLQARQYAAPSLTAAERALASAALPRDPQRALIWNVATMELGALVCQARTPQCQRCPVRERCAWLGAGRPAYQGPARRAQAWAGTDRQVRGALLAILRERPEPVSAGRLATAWPDAAQRDRCLDSLVADGLVEPLPDGSFRLPGSGQPGRRRRVNG